MFDVVHEVLGFLDGVDDLGLDEFGADGLFAFEFEDFGFDGDGAGVGGDADVEFGWVVDVVVFEVFAFVGDFADEVGEAGGVEVEDGFGFGGVAEAGVVAGQGEDVFDAHGAGGEEVAEEGEAVAVAAGHLADGFKPNFLLDDVAGSEAVHVGEALGDVGDVGGDDVADEFVGAFEDFVHGADFFGFDFAGEGELAGVEALH